MNRFITRPPVKQHQVEQAIRLRMIDGPLGPGAQLPRRDDLQEEFKVSRDTIQRVFDHLSDDGFIVAKGRGGTFVAERPPHLHRFALVFNEPVKKWSRFWHALRNEASTLSRAREREIVCFSELAPHADNRAYRQLQHDVRTTRLAGIILASPPLELAGDAILAEPRIPCVSVMMGPPQPGLPIIYPDHGSFIERALDWLLERSRRRVAVLTTPTYPNDHVRMALAKRGMSADPRWLQGMAPQAAEWSRNLVQLLMSGTAEQRPDALLITDDNLVEHAMSGVVAAGLRIPHDLDVVGHCNFPWPAPSMLPIRRLGFNAREVLDGCLALIADQRAGRQPRMETLVPARFEDEIQP
jgi:DNA-binding LacI/PurR family transcriptional regulator